MSETTMIHTRVPVELKEDAEKILKKLGITMSEAVRSFLAQIKLNKGIPYESRIPNKETRKALDAFLKGDRTGYKTYSNFEEFKKEYN